VLAILLEVFDAALEIEVAAAPPILREPLEVAWSRRLALDALVDSGRM